MDYQSELDELNKQMPTHLAEEHIYLKWFAQYADFGPAHHDVVLALQEQYERETGLPVPEGWSYRDDEDE